MRVKDDRTKQTLEESFSKMTKATSNVSQGNVAKVAAIMKLTFSNCDLA